MDGWDVAQHLLHTASESAVPSKPSMPMHYNPDIIVCDFCGCAASSRGACHQASYIVCECTDLLCNVCKFFFFSPYLRTTVYTTSCRCYKDSGKALRSLQQHILGKDLCHDILLCPFSCCLQLLHGCSCPIATAHQTNKAGCRQAGKHQRTRTPQQCRGLVHASTSPGEGICCSHPRP